MRTSDAPENRDMWLINHWQERALKAEAALGEIAWSNDSQWQADRAKAALAAKHPSPTVQAQEALAVPAVVDAEAWEHLKQYGYAPGGYMSKCRTCGTVVIMDKRAICCRPCAEVKHGR